MKLKLTSVVKTSIKAMILMATFMTTCNANSCEGGPLLTVAEAQSFYGLENVDRLDSESCGDICLIEARDGNNGPVLALFNASDTSQPLFTVSDAQAFYGLENVDRLGSSFPSCGDRCLIQAQDGGFGLAIFDLSDTSQPLFTVSDAQEFYGLENVVRISIFPCNDRCLIQADGAGFAGVLAYFDASDTSQPLLTLSEVQAFYGLGTVEELVARTCGDACIVEAREAGGFVRLAIFDLSDPSQPLFTVSEAQSFYGLENVNQLSFATCGDRCLLGAGVGNNDLALFDASDTSQPLFTVSDAQAFYGLENVDRLSAISCGDRCLIEAGGTPFGFTIAFFDVSDTSQPLFTLSEAQGFYGAENINRLDSFTCGDQCLIGGLSFSTTTVLFDASDLYSGPLLTVSEAQAFSGLENVDRLSAVSCADECLIGAQDGSQLIAFFNPSDTSQPLLTVSEAQAFSGLESVDRLIASSCGDRCFIGAQAGFNTTIALFDVSDTSEPFFTVAEAQAFAGLENTDRLFATACGDRCLIQAQAGSFNTLAIFDAGDLYSGPIFTLSDAQVFYGLENVDRLNSATCGDRCLIGASGNSATLALFDLNNMLAFPALDIAGLENLVACRGDEFCYELTVSNPINENQNEASGNITVTGLLDTDWTVTKVIDCSNGETSYTGPVGTVWTNLLDQSITFDEAGTGTWTIGILQPNTSICLKLCGTDPNVGNKTLDIEVIQTP